MINQEKRTIIVTGASRGLGLALVKTFIKETNHLIMAISRDGSGLLTWREAEGMDDRLVVLEADICNTSHLERLAEKLRALPPVGVLVHNAGMLLFKPFSEIDVDSLKSVYEVNVFAPFMLTQVVLPYMKAAHVINISSVGGVEGSLKFAGLSAYSSSKAALNCLTEMWSEEFKDTDHCFNCLALGSVETEMFKEAFPGVPAASQPEEMASYIVHFAAEAPSVMRGKIISLSRSNP